MLEIDFYRFASTGDLLYWDITGDLYLRGIETTLYVLFTRGFSEYFLSKVS